MANFIRGFTCIRSPSSQTRTRPETRVWQKGSGFGIPSENAENCRCRQPHCRLTPPPRATSKNIRIILIPLEATVIGLHFCPGSVGMSSFKFLWWAPKDASFQQQSAYLSFKVIRGR